MQKKLTGFLPSAAAAALIVSLGLALTGCQQPEVLTNRPYIPAPNSDVSVPPSAPVMVPGGMQNTAATETVVLTETEIIEPTENVNEVAPAKTDETKKTIVKENKYPKFTGNKNGPKFTETKLAPSNAKAGKGEYIVQRGDSLSVIAQRSGVKTADLAAVNGLTAGSIIRVGQKLRLPEGGVTGVAKSQNKPETIKKSDAGRHSKANTASATRPVDGIYTVQKNDALWLIARKFDTTVNTLCELNNIQANKALQVGQKIKLPGAPMTIESTTPTTSTTSTTAPVTSSAVPSTSAPVSVTPTTTTGTTIATTPSVPVNPATVTSQIADTPTTQPTPITPEPAVTTQTMAIQRDIPLESFCKLYRIDIEEIKRLNPNLPADGILRYQQTVIMPVPTK